METNDLFIEGRDGEDLLKGLLNDQGERRDGWDSRWIAAHLCIHIIHFVQRPGGPLHSSYKVHIDLIEPFASSVPREILLYHRPAILAHSMRQLWVAQ